MANSLHDNTRRKILKSSAFGFLTVLTSNIIAVPSAKEIVFNDLNEEVNKNSRFPSIADEVVSEVVGKSHFDLERVQELVNGRQELARATWDWGFGDWESAVGAASHVGRRDIARFLINKGARPSVFTFAMLGAEEAVRTIIKYTPGIQRTMGPHGISLLDHAYAGERMKPEMNQREIDGLQKTIEYLESLGDAGGDQYMEVSPEDQLKYLGNYRYGDGPKDGFTIRLNMRKLLSLGRLDEFGGALYKVDENRFMYNGAPSVVISFDIQDGIVKSLTVKEPTFEITANKVG